MKNISSVISLSFLALFLIVFSLPSICFAELDPKVWEYFGIDSGGNFVYYNTTNLTKSSDVISVWTYTQMSYELRVEQIEIVKKYDLKKYPHYENFDHNISLLQIDCNKGLKTIKEYIDYDDKGKILDHKIDENSKWENIIPETIVDRLFQKICVIQNKPYLQDYCNGRYGFCVKYPSNFKMKPPPLNGDGNSFFDGKGFSMTVSGINNVLEDNLKTEMTSQGKDFDKITFQTKGKDWFVLSGYKGADILYLKTYIGTSSSNHLYIKYPLNQKNVYNEIVTNIVKSFKPGNLNESH